MSWRNVKAWGSYYLSATIQKYILHRPEPGLFNYFQIRNFGKEKVDLGPEELKKLKEDILTPKNFQPTSTASDFEQNFEDFGRKKKDKKDKLSSKYYGMVLYQPQVQTDLKYNNKYYYHNKHNNN